MPSSIPLSQPTNQVAIAQSTTILHTYGAPIKMLYVSQKEHQGRTWLSSPGT